MDQTVDQITHDIQNTSENLRSNFQELESKMKSVTDWRYHFQNHTGLMIATAFAGGALLSLLSAARGSRASAAAPVASYPEAQRSSIAGGGSEVLTKWKSMKSAIVAVAAARLTGYLDQVVPGFHDELKKAETGRSQNSNGRLA